MELNGINCIGYEQIGNTVKITLACTMQQALDIDASELKITEQGEDIAVFGGYELTGVSKSGEYVNAIFAKELEANTAQTLSALEQNLAIANKKITVTQTTATATNKQVGEISTQLEAYGQAIEELAQSIG